MQWVLSHNLFKERGHDDLVATLRRLELPFTVTKKVPFVDRLLPEDVETGASLDLDKVPDVTFPLDRPLMAMGTYGLAHLMYKRGHRPAAFFDGLDSESWMTAYGDRTLNHDAKVISLRDFGSLQLEGSCFMRPVEDDKSFAGKVFTCEEIHTWVAGLERLSREHHEVPPTLTPETKVVVSSVKEILTETRHFVVDGKIVTRSLYRRGGRVHYTRDGSEDATAFARECIQHWVPSRAFVIDVAETLDGPKIVELNCINAAGFYAAEVDKIVYAMEESFGS